MNEIRRRAKSPSFLSGDDNKRAALSCTQAARLRRPGILRHLEILSLIMHLKQNTGILRISRGNDLRHKMEVLSRGRILSDGSGYQADTGAQPTAQQNTTIVLRFSFPFGEILWRNPRNSSLTGHPSPKRSDGWNLWSRKNAFLLAAECLAQPSFLKKKFLQKREVEWNLSSMLVRKRMLSALGIPLKASLERAAHRPRRLAKAAHRWRLGRSLDRFSGSPVGLSPLKSTETGESEMIVCDGSLPLLGPGTMA